VSASVDDDDYFELMIRNAWHMSGGEGQCANTSCRRVLVTFTDGRQEVVEIENDLGLAADDMAGMRERLEAQGVTGITKISLARLCNFSIHADPRPRFSQTDLRSVCSAFSDPATMSPPSPTGFF